MIYIAARRRCSCRSLGRLFSFVPLGEAEEEEAEGRGELHVRECTG